MIYTIRYLWRKLWGKCTHPVFKSYAVRINGVPTYSCMKCHKAVQKHGDYWF